MAPLDITIPVPPLTPSGTVLLTNAEMRDMQRDYDTMKDAAGSMATVSLALILMLCEPGTETVTVPRSVIDQVRGSQLQLAETPDGDLTCRVVNRSPRLIVVAG